MNAIRLPRFGFLLPLLLLSAIAARGQGFTSGSTGADGALDVTANTELPARPNGVFNYTTIRVRPRTRLSFARHAANPPIHLLATEEVVIEGSVDISGDYGSALNGGAGGSGGFDGGKPGIAGLPPGGGYGPGGGKPGTAGDQPNGAGGGSYATIQPLGSSTNKGTPYGTSLLLPLVGGSGGGGQPGVGGNGGGGALLIASTLSIDIRAGASVYANGGAGGASWGYGSGGAIRLVAPEVMGSGALQVSGGGYGGDGRIRVDLVRRNNLNLTFTPGTPGTLVIGSLMTIFPPVSSQLDIVAVGTERFTPGQQNSVFVNLPAGANPNQQVEVQARDFNRNIPITLALIPDSGQPAFFQATLDNVAANPVSRKITVPFPANVLVRVMAWTR